MALWRGLQFMAEKVEDKIKKLDFQAHVKTEIRP